MEHSQRLAAKAVRRVLAGATVSAALPVDGSVAPDSRALVHDLVYGTLRHLGQVRAIVHALAERELTDASVESLLWVALYQLLHTGTAPHAVVDSAVRATGRLKKSSARGLTNAILRNFLRRRDAILSAIGADDEARYSYPRWWIERVREEYGERASALMTHGNVRAPLTLRVNPRVTNRAAFIATLQAAGHAARPVGAAGVILETTVPVTGLPGFVEGAFSVQDAGAQLAAPLLDVRDGMRVLDACAAPGGKTTHLAELASIELVALDSDASRIGRVTQNLSRLNLEASVALADAGEPADWWDGVGFDRVLLDVPCTASGVVRRHPDAKWLRREGDIATFGQQQHRLLDALWPCLAPRGVLLYATCSIFGAENGAQVEAFLRRHPDASRLPLALPPGLGDLEGQLLPSAPGAEHNHDGFFYALLQKK